MRLFGYKRDGTDLLLSLVEVSIEAELGQVRTLADFLEEVIATMERAGDAFGHEHFRDFCIRKGIALTEGDPDVIVVRKK